MRGKRRIHAPFRAPCSSVLFPSTLLVRISLECLSPFFFFFSPARFQGSLLSTRYHHCHRRRVSFFFLSGWLPRSAKTRKEGERNWPAPLIPSYLSLSFSLSHSVSSSVVLALSSTTSSSLPSPCSSVVAAARWFVNAKFKLSRATLLHEPLCDANEATNTSTLSKSPREPPPPPQTPKRAYQ